MQFEKQDYQNECVKNIINVLRDFDFSLHNKNELKNYLQTFYNNNPNIPIKTLSNKLNLDILMETGTGKTFTYLKTIYELNKHYKQNKFIIFVPRKAIREGVLQNIKLTSDYFEQEYKKRLVKYTYDSDKSISAIQTHFLHNKDELSVLVLTNSSIDKEKNILRTPKESLFGSKSIVEAISKIKPIIIIDEPHLLKGEAFTKIFKDFNSLYLRFGATFPTEDEHKLSNMIYSLDSIHSFKNYLVKKIRVNSIINENSALKIIDIKNKIAQLSYFENGIQKRKVVRINETLNILNHKDVAITKITKDKVFLSNETILHLNNPFVLSDEEIEVMVAKTIAIHFEKEEKNFINGVKTLSLFFIPNVADYRDNGKIKQIFEKEYIKKREEILKTAKDKNYIEYLKKDINEKGLCVDEGYFSGDRGNTDEKIAYGVDLILKDKEKLLSFDSSLRFIFSVWALQEGWDNPNIFNICKLTNTEKDISRRQQVGRGLRICVNQDGRRQTYNYFNEDEDKFYEYNTLDMVVSSYEKDFINEIQKEIIQNSFAFSGDILTSRMLEDSYGFTSRNANKILEILEECDIVIYDEVKDEYTITSSIDEFLKSNKDKFNFLSDEKFQILKDIFVSNDKLPIEDANKPKQKIHIRKTKLDEFKELWETINKQANIIYKDINEETLIENICKEFNNLNIAPLHIKIETKTYNPQADNIEYVSLTNIDEQKEFFKDGRFDDFIFDFCKEEKMPLIFILKLFKKLKIENFANNPKEAKSELKRILKEQIHANIIHAVNYKFSQTNVITKLQNEDGKYKDYLFLHELGRYFDDKQKPPKNYLYEQLAFDSNVEKESILKDPQNIDKNEIVVFAKLPKINIPTPYKTYSPDFAYFVKKDDGSTLFLVVEAKGYKSESEISKEEMKKIDYAKIFFEKLKDELPKNITISFKTRINTTNLASLIKG